MEILLLEVDGFKGISVARVEADGAGVVRIVGLNGQGKTSLLDGIEYGLLGGRVPEGAVNNNSEKAQINIVLGAEGKSKYNVERVIRDGKTPKLILTSADGEPIKSAQKFLDDIVGSIAYDPGKLLTMANKDLLDVLSKATGLDTDSLNREYKEHFADRAVENKSIKKLDAQIKKGLVKVEPIDTAEITRKISEQNSLKNAEEKYINDGDIIKAEIAELENKASDLRKLVETQYSRPTIALHNFDIEIEELASQLNNAVEISQQASEYEQNEKYKAEKFTATREALRLDVALQGITMQKVETISSLGIEDLSLEEFTDDLLYKGNPLASASSSEKIKVSMKVAMATNPRVRVCIIRDGSLIDGNGLVEIQRIAKESEFQVWIESVGSDSDEDAIIIKEGKVDRVIKNDF